MKKSKLRDTGCPVAYALDIFGDRWSLIIIRDILMKGVSTYSALLAADEKIATNILASRLKELEESQIIKKIRDPENKRQYLYSITPKGAELTPIILEMMRWSSRYDANTKVTKKVLKRLEADREGFIKEVIQKALTKNLN